MKGEMGGESKACQEIKQVFIGCFVLCNHHLHTHTPAFTFALVQQMSDLEFREVK